MYVEDFTLNQTFDVPDVVIDREQMMAFARLYDPMPFHLDEAYAQTTRFGGLIAPGVMAFMTVWAQFTQSGIFGDGFVAGRSTRIEWLLPIYPGDTLSTRAAVTSITRRNAHNAAVEVTFQIYNQHGELVMTDLAEGVFQYRS